MIKVIARENEDPADLFRRFKKLSNREHKRPWYKHRYGYYEKPSVLHRKRRKMQRRNKHHDIYTRIVCPINLETLFSRTGPNATGR